MKDKILIYYSPFSAASQIWLVKDGKASSGHISSSLEELSENVVGLAYSQNIFDVAVSAPYALMNEIITAVRDQENSSYSTNKINIEVM